MSFRGLAVFLSLIASCASGQTPASQKRPDGAATPLMVYGAPAAHSSCPPLAVFSHGAGGSERGYAYLAQGLADRGWMVIVMGHRESGRDALLADIGGGNPRAGIQQLVATPSAYNARMMDVTAALDWATGYCKDIPFRALLGHSMGGETVMLEAGAINKIGVDPKLTGRDRFDAYVAMSSEGPGLVFPANAWQGIHKPMFVFTGTLDGALNGGPQTRIAPYTGLPGDHGCDWLGVIYGATHQSFGGRGPDTARINAEIITATDAFLGGVKKGDCSLPAKVAGFRLEGK